MGDDVKPGLGGLLRMTPQERLNLAANVDAPRQADAAAFALTNPLGTELHQDQSTGKPIIRSSSPQADQGGEGAMGQARLGGVTQGGRVNLADAERARAQFLAAKAATVHPSDRAGMMNTASSDGSPRHVQAVRPLSHEESLAKAVELIAGARTGAQALGSQGPAIGANRNDAGGQTPAWLTSYMDKEPDEIL